MQSNSNILLKDLLKQVSEVDILNHYLVIKELPCLISSPLRVDTKPSFRLYVTHTNKVRYYDLAKKDGGGLFDLLKQLWGTTFQGAIDKVYTDLKSINKTQIPISYSSGVYAPGEAKGIGKIEVKLRKWESHDKEYWMKYGLPVTALLFANIYPVSHILLHKQGVINTLVAHKYAYVYIENKDNVCTYKVYQPYNKKCKWLNSHNSSVWDLWSKLPMNGDKLIITSSRKDALCLWYHTGIPAVSLQGEGYIPKDSVVAELKERFKTIYVLFDNDYNKECNVGRENASHLCSKFDLTFIEIPAFLESKDPSDLYYNHGEEIFKDTMNKLIYEKEINSLFAN